jgi:cold shock CspA family protein
MPKGTVEWFRKQKDFGFIEQKDGPDAFDHHSARGTGQTGLL